MMVAKKRITSLDVARLAGVSQSAVSRTFTPGASVSPETRDKVLQAAKQLGYKPNVLARGLSGKRTNLIGIVMANIENPFYPHILAKFATRFQEMGKQILLLNAPPNTDVDDRLLLMMQYQVDGVIITSATLSSAMADECVKMGTPVVLFNRYVVAARASAVCCDAVASGRTIADALISAGHQRIAFMAGKEDTSTNRDRERGFRERLEERGYPLYLRDCGDFEYEAGYEAARRMLGRDEPPDAIFCANDLMGMATLDVARHIFGMKIPEELSVIGYDDITMASWPAYSLTTFRQPVDRMIDATIEVLVHHIDNPNGERELRFIPGELVQRASSKRSAELEEGVVHVEENFVSSSSR